MLVVAKPVTWTLDPNRSRKTRSKYNDILSCVGKPKGSVTVSQNIFLIPLLTMRFRHKPHWGSFHPLPVAWIRVKHLVCGSVLLHVTRELSSLYPQCTSFTVPFTS